MMLSLFHRHISEASGQRALFVHCTQNLHLPGDFTDLLRNEIVNILSAFDKLIHDIIIHLSVETISGRRPPTPKFSRESLTISQAESLRISGGLPIDAIFEIIMRHKLSTLCFMDPAKLADGLSLVWNEDHKWQKIGDAMGQNEKTLRITLSNASKRRNSIVHEADYDPAGGGKLPITPTDAEHVSNFILALGNTIHSLVI